MSDLLLKIEEGLEESFLYENDPDSLHILLSIIEHGYRFHHFQPHYRLMKNLSGSLKRILKERRDRELILLAIRKVLNDDINRFELAIEIKGYTQGMQDLRLIDALERIALETYSVDELASCPLLFHKAKSGKAMGVQAEAFRLMHEDENKSKDLHRLSNFYCRKLLKKKIYHLNDYLDRQIVLDFDHPDQLKSEEGALTIRDLNLIYNKLNRYLFTNVTKLYKHAYWDGINDAVLERYS